MNSRKRKKQLDKNNLINIRWDFYINYRRWRLDSIWTYQNTDNE